MVELKPAMAELTAPTATPSKTSSTSFHVEETVELEFVALASIVNMAFDLFQGYINHSLPRGPLKYPLGFFVGRTRRKIDMFFCFLLLAMCNRLYFFHTIDKRLEKAVAIICSFPTRASEMPNAERGTIEEERRHCCCCFVCGVVVCY